MLSPKRWPTPRHKAEEFVALFRDMTVREVQTRLDEAREHLATGNFRKRTTDEPIGDIAVSGGIANVFRYPDSGAAMEAADKALLRAKVEGRNRVLIA